jgi:outer membrane biosynthesis protein TonB
MDTFNRQKNMKAGTLTGVICGLLLFLFFIISWTPPQPAEIPPEEGIEVNLGNSETGLGDIQPLIPDAPSRDLEDVNMPPKSTLAEAEPPREVETNDNDAEAPPVVAPKPETPARKPVNPEKKPSPVVTKPSTKPVPVENPKPDPPRPKYVYKGGDGSGSGGNNADTWNNSKNQGIAGGKGDQGKINGNPNSDSYTGNGGSGKSGVTISRGLSGRRITRLPSFEDEFNENAKVAVDIRVDNNGKVTSATYQPRGSTTSDAGMREIALRKARQLTFNASPNSPETDIGTIIFNFRLKN